MSTSHMSFMVQPAPRIAKAPAEKRPIRVRVEWRGIGALADPDADVNVNVDAGEAIAIVANDRDHKQGCRSSIVPIGLSIRARRA